MQAVLPDRQRLSSRQNCLGKRRGHLPWPMRPLTALLNTRCRDGIWKTNLCPQATEMRAISTSGQADCGDPCNFQLLLARLELKVTSTAEKLHILWSILWDLWTVLCMLLQVLAHQTEGCSCQEIMQRSEHPGPNLLSKTMVFGLEMLF